MPVILEALDKQNQTAKRDSPLKSAGYKHQNQQ